MSTIIKKTDYNKIRTDFNTKAKNWNGILKVWWDSSPSYSRTVWGNKGWKIQMNDTIPLYERNYKYLSKSSVSSPYSVNENITVENQNIHTLENENNIRRSMKTLKTMVDGFLNEENYIEVYKVTYTQDYEGTHTVLGTFYTTTPSTTTSNEIEVYYDIYCSQYYGKTLKYARYRKGSWFNRKYVYYKTNWVEGPYRVQIDDLSSNITIGIDTIGQTGSIYPTPPLSTLPYNTSYVIKEEDNYTLNSEKLPMEDILTKDYSTVTNLDNDKDTMRKSNYDQLNIILDKLQTYLTTKDNWFDSSNRCKRSCQIKCQSGCQISCQACNTRQCHDQKCGVH